MPVSTECAAALLSFRYPSSLLVKAIGIGFSDLAEVRAIFPRYEIDSIIHAKGHLDIFRYK